MLAFCLCERMILVLLLIVSLPMHRMMRVISKQPASVKTSLFCMRPFLQTEFHANPPAMTQIMVCMTRYVAAMSCLQPSCDHSPSMPNHIQRQLVPSAHSHSDSRLLTRQSCTGVKSAIIFCCAHVLHFLVGHDKPAQDVEGFCKVDCGGRHSRFAFGVPLVSRAKFHRSSLGLCKLVRQLPQQAPLPDPVTSPLTGPLAIKACTAWHAQPQLSSSARAA